MDLAQVIVPVQRAHGVPAGSVDRAELTVGLAAVERVARWVEAWGLRPPSVKRGTKRHFRSYLGKPGPARGS